MRTRSLTNLNKIETLYNSFDQYLLRCSELFRLKLSALYFLHLQLAYKGPLKDAAHISEFDLVHYIKLFGKFNFFHLDFNVFQVFSSTLNNNNCRASCMTFKL